MDVFLKFPCFLYDPTDVDNLISGPSAFPVYNTGQQSAVLGVKLAVSLGSAYDWKVLNHTGMFTLWETHWVSHLSFSHSNAPYIPKH